MKQLSTAALFLLLLCNATFSKGQYKQFHTTATIDVGNIDAAHSLYGDLWYDTTAFGNAVTEHCRFPKGASTNLGGVSGLWLSGEDAASNQYFSAQYGAPNSFDYWPGPADTGLYDAASAYARSQQWARFWQISAVEIDAFKRMHGVPGYTISDVIMEWPAKGNPHAKGANGATLTINEDMAPFVDANGDGGYDATKGDYPLMKGDQMLWWVYNDWGATHNAVYAPFQVTVRMCAYAYGRSTVLNNVIFYEYVLSNRSTNSYDNFRMGIYTDCNLGYWGDDFVGFDSSRRMGIAYNGKNTDGSGLPTEYGTNPPMMGMALLELPGDSMGRYNAAGSFSSMANAFTADRYTMMYASYSGSRYMYDDSAECNLKIMPGDRSFLMTSNDMSLLPGETKKLTVALVAASNAGGCPLQTYTGIHDVADTAWNVYWASHAALGIPSGHPSLVLRLHPNPVTETLFVNVPDGAEGGIQVHDMLSKRVSIIAERTAGGFRLATSSLSPGIYTLQYATGELVLTERFVKQ